MGFGVDQGFCLQGFGFQFSGSRFGLGVTWKAPALVDNDFDTEIWQMSAFVRTIREWGWEYPGILSQAKQSS